MALATVGVLGFGVGRAAALTLPNTLHSTTTTTPVRGTVTSVVLRGDVGDLTVTAGAPAKVTTTRRWNLVAPTVTQSFAGGVLTVTTRCPQLPENNCSVDVTVVAPAVVSVDATAGVGDIATTALAGNENLRTAVGAVVVTNVRADVLRATAWTGSIAVQLPSAPARTTLTTSTGSIDATVPRGVYALAASTGVGDVHVHGVTNDPAAPHALTAKTETGDITIVGR